MGLSNLADLEVLKLHHSFDMAHNFHSEKYGPCLPFLCAVWMFHENLTIPRFICGANSTSLTGVSRWLSFFYKAILPMANDLCQTSESLLFLLLVDGF
jgi:hypothetical protein